MKRLLALVSFFFVVCLLAFAGQGSPAYASGRDIVVLLHGLGRTMKSMDYLQSQLTNEGYKVVNISYPSRKKQIEDLVEFLHQELLKCCLNKSLRLHFVTHSLGGILVRGYLAKNKPENLGRIVMLSPPNKGSDVVDFFEDSAMLEYFLGPAATELGTGLKSFPNKLGPADFEVGIITGNRTIDPISSLIIDGDDDGKVSIEQAKLEGMADFMVVEVSHAYIMRNPYVVDQAIFFLKNGSFNRNIESPGEGKK
jgi:pimeloyl-ACP methyl ester carboxylesterase